MFIHGCIQKFTLRFFAALLRNILEDNLLHVIDENTSQIQELVDEKLMRQAQEQKINELGSPQHRSDSE